MKHRYLSNVATLALDADKCVGCGMCEIVCPHGVFAITGRKASIEDRDLCMECGACAKNCPAEAITVDAGVGCASAIIYSWFAGKEPTYGCSDDSACC
jgi:NAD-dependent dihydropyrimidine dehydrogenase PreA subunit